MARSRFSPALGAAVAGAEQLTQIGVMFPVKPPDGTAWEYRWRFGDSSVGQWRALGDRSDVQAPPAATGIDWRPAPLSQPTA